MVILIFTAGTFALIRAQKTIFETFTVHFEATSSFALAWSVCVRRLELEIGGGGRPAKYRVD